MKSTLERTYKPAAKSDWDRLVLDNLDYVGRILSTMVIATRDADQRDNLHSAGVLGLVQAASSYDPSQGVAFRTFAYPRIRGAIVDELRKLSPLSPRVMKHVSVVRELYESMEPPVTPEGLSKHSGLSLDEVHEALEAMRFIKPESWKDLSEIIYDAWHHDYQSPRELVEQKEITLLVAELIEDLPEKERLVLTLYYKEELNLAEVGAVLGLSESRISRLLASARFQLGEAIRWKTR
ncbi:RNA polymerase sigma factor FliA [Stieleria bergensis]|uniref:RNA polymerase sigma factor FliA n=1 Tax=Stieleria bergensis TaxID=2528025 RepID=A0A517SSV9_9BACT|nr:RNA polymerase sigma factor FliA [Planctomycetes bacterium SV_7m_r]